MHLILLGPPGAGKGTQAIRLAEATGLVHIATGDMFRDNVRRETELGIVAQRYMEAGELVPDDVTIGMLLARLDAPDAGAGSMLDGFPRTVEQANALDAALAGRSQQVDSVLLLDVPADVVRRRLGGRWSCPVDGAVFHETNNPPQRAGLCDRCGEALVQRDDDTPEAIPRRLQVYEEQTAPLVAFYERAGKLIRVNGAQSPDRVGADLVSALGMSV